jgi:glycosyltransferase involved in cell wall biosynthesis
VPLTIASVAYPLAAVSEDSVGGAEQVLASLDRALVAAGHSSFVVAAEGSSVSGTLIAVPAEAGSLDRAAQRRAQQATWLAIRQLLDRRHIDLVHLHGIDFMAYLPPPGVPTLATLHLPPTWYPPAAFALTRPDTWLQAVSLSQHRQCPPAHNLLPPITNGVDLQRFRPRYTRSEFALSLGRICPEKGLHCALDAAHDAGVPLLIGGRVYRYDEHRQYFEMELRPRLRPPHRFLGPVGMTRKQQLLRAARCVLIPSLVPETSSLVAMEALASGTPVIAFAAGALAEIVRHGENGFLVSDRHEMACAMRYVDQIDRGICRQSASQQFDGRRTIAAYFDVYERLVRRRFETPYGDHHQEVRIH